MLEREEAQRDRRDQQLPGIDRRSRLRRHAAEHASEAALYRDRVTRRRPEPPTAVERLATHQADEGLTFAEEVDVAADQDLESGADVSG